jgi:hypothetical protein
MNRDDIKKVLALCVDSICDDCPYADTKDCYNQIKLDARELIIKQEKEIEKLKAENIRLTTKLGQVLLSIDTVKEMNTMCSIDEQRKQAKIDVLNELKEKCHNYYPSIDHYCCSVKAVTLSDINEMIAEVQNAEDKS